jgi:hypothetical protein
MPQEILDTVIFWRPADLLLVWGNARGAGRTECRRWERMIRRGERAWLSSKMVKFARLLTHVDITTFRTDHRIYVIFQL